MSLTLCQKSWKTHAIIVTECNRLSGEWVLSSHSGIRNQESGVQRDQTGDREADHERDRERENATNFILHW